jgi:hypothetical protein
LATDHVQDRPYRHCRLQGETPGKVAAQDACHASEPQWSTDAPKRGMMDSDGTRQRVVVGTTATVVLDVASRGALSDPDEVPSA